MSVVSSQILVKGVMQTSKEVLLGGTTSDFRSGSAQRYHRVPGQRIGGNNLALSESSSSVPDLMVITPLEPWVLSVFDLERLRVMITRQQRRRH